MDSTALAGVAFAAIGIAVGAAFLLIARALEARVEAARQWNEVPAVIESARLSHLGKGRFAPRLTYSYSVAGAYYTGRRLQFGSVAMSRDEAEQVMAAFPSGSPTTVRYDPHRHDFAVLRAEANVRRYRLVALMTAVVCLATGLLVVVAS